MGKDAITVYLVAEVAPDGGQNAICIHTDLDEAKREASQPGWYGRMIYMGKADGSALTWLDWEPTYD